MTPLVVMAGNGLGTVAALSPGRERAYARMDALFAARLAEQRWERAWERGDQRAADRQARIAAGAMARWRRLREVE